MSDRFAILPAATTSNWSAIGTWSASSGGATGASVPTSADDVYVDALSVAGAAAILQLSANATCKALNWTGATNTPAFDFNNFFLFPYGSITFITGMTVTNIGQIRWSGSAACTFTTAGKSLGGQVYCGVAGFTGSVTLQDDLTNTLIFGFEQGTLDTNGKTVTTPWFFIGSTSSAKTLTLGASIINITGASGWNYAGTNLTLTTNTAVIKLTGTAAFTGGSITTYNEVQLNGTAHTITGSNTFAFLKFGPAGAQTITFTDGTTQTVLNPPTRTGTGQIIFWGSGAGGWGITTGQQRVILSNMSITYSTALPRNTWFASPPSTDNDYNFNWIFQSPPMGGGWWVLRH